MTRLVSSVEPLSTITISHERRQRSVQRLSRQRRSCCARLRVHTTTDSFTVSWLSVIAALAATGTPGWEILPIMGEQG
jgi:hypothetical protein